MKTECVEVPSPGALEEIRGRIDELDTSLVDLMAARVALAREAAAMKTNLGMPRDDLAREAAIIRRASALAREKGMEPEAARDVFWRLVTLCRTAPMGSPGPGSP